MLIVGGTNIPTSKQELEDIEADVNICATDQQPNKVFKFLRSHSHDITSYATKLPEKEKK